MSQSSQAILLQDPGTFSKAMLSSLSFCHMMLVPCSCTSTSASLGPSSNRPLNELYRDQRDREALAEKPVIDEAAHSRPG
jgi:hypothetical protein